MQLGGCDVVLGVDWMKEVSPISFDFNKREVSFDKEGRKMTWLGEKESGSCKMISGRKLHKMLKSKWCQLSQLFSLMAMGKGTLVAVEGGPKAKINGGAHTTQLKKIDQVHTQHLIDELLDSYKDQFAEPTTLPPT